MDVIEVGVFRDERATEAHLRAMPEGRYSLHPSSTVSDGRLRGSTVRVRGARVVLTPVDEPVSDRISLESSDGQMRTIAESIRGRPELAHLAAEGYAIKPLAAGSSGSFETTVEHFLFSGCVHAGVYFDLVACSGARVATYAHKSAVPWLRHSADKFCAGLLVHTLSLVGTEGGHAVLCAVGYCYKPLCEFAALWPYMAMVDAETRTVWVVPFSLDRESIGHASTLIAPLAISVRGTRVRYVVPERPFHMPGVNTGMYPPELARFVSVDKLDFESAWRARSAQAALPARAEAEQAEHAERSPLVASTRVTVMLEDGLEPPDAPWGHACLVRLGTTLAVSVPASRPGRAEPSAFYAPVFPGSTASGTQRSLLMCTHSADMSTEQYRAHVASVPTVVYVTPGSFKEADVGASHHRLHGVMVVVGLGLNRRDDLAGLSVPAMRLMGARSVVLYTDSERHYFIRGAPGIWRFLPEPLAFGAEVDFSVDSVLSARAPWPYISPQGDRGVLFRGAIVDAGTVLEAVLTIVRDEAPSPDLACALAQLRVVLDAAEARDLKSALVSQLAERAERTVAPIRARRAELVRALVEHARADPEIGTLRHAEREARRALRPFADLIESVCSERVASSRASASLDLQAAARKSLIAQRVGEAARMSDAEFGELLAAVPFFAIAEATPHIDGLLRAASTASMEASLVALSQSTAPVRLSTRAVTLDGSTVAAVLEWDHHVSHVLEAESSVAFPMGGHSCVPFAVTEAALAWDGGALDWMRVANERAAQLLRIKLRGCFAGIRRFAIDPASRELTLALVAMLLSLAQGVCGLAAERDATTQQILRGALHMLFSVSASGTTPALWVFQLTQPHADRKLPATDGEWNVYAGVLECLMRLAAPETARADLRRAACSLVCLALRRFTDERTQPLRAGVCVARLDAQAQAVKSADERRQWARAAMHVLSPPVGAPDEFFPLVEVPDPQAAARALLARASAWKEQRHMRAYRRALQALADGAPRHDVGAETAKYFARWSGVFADAKRAVLDGAGIATLDERAALVAQTLRVERVSVSNYAAFASGDRQRMLGDAELARTTWPRGAREWCGRAPPDVAPYKTWRALLGEPSAPCPSAALPQTSPAVEVPTLDVVARAARVPLAHLTRILAALGLDADHAREAVRILLRTWRDPNAPDAEAYLVRASSVHAPTA